MKTAPIYLALALACAGVGSAWAQSKSEAPLWELGAFGLGVSQQAYPGSDQQIRRHLIFPFFLYRGQLLRSEQGSIGLRAMKTEALEVDVGASASFGSGGDGIHARVGMPKLGTLFEFGPRVKWTLTDSPSQGRWTLELPLRGVFDLSDGGQHRGIAFAPDVVFSRRSASGWAYSASLGAIIANRELADTYYGVAAPYALSTRPIYHAKSGLVAWRAGITAQRSITPDWRFFSFARLDSVAGAANEDSPLVKQTSGLSVGVGLSYTWLRSETKALP